MVCKYFVVTFSFAHQVFTRLDAGVLISFARSRDSRAAFSRKHSQCILMCIYLFIPLLFLYARRIKFSVPIVGKFFPGNSATEGMIIAKVSESRSFAHFRYFAAGLIYMKLRKRFRNCNIFFLHWFFFLFRGFGKDELLLQDICKTIIMRREETCWL